MTIEKINDKSTTGQWNGLEVQRDLESRFRALGQFTCDRKQVQKGFILSIYENTRTKTKKEIKRITKRKENFLISSSRTSDEVRHK